MKEVPSLEGFVLFVEKELSFLIISIVQGVGKSILIN